MAVNLDKPMRWKANIAQSVDMYNAWFLAFAPEAFRATRAQTAATVAATLELTRNMTTLQPALLAQHPQILPTLRMLTCPPIATDRLIGLAGVAPNLVRTMENSKHLPVRMDSVAIEQALGRILAVIEKLADPDILVWLQRPEPPTTLEIDRAVTIIADRLCGAVANPIIRNA